jgi:cyclophilin family peptidyl-prolyl cis-trans isomerase
MENATGAPRRRVRISTNAAAHGGAPMTGLPQLRRAHAPTGSRAWIRFEWQDGSGTVTFMLDDTTCPRAVANFRYAVESHRDTAELHERLQNAGRQHDKPLPPPLAGTSITAIRHNEMMEFGTSPTQSFWGGFFDDEWDPSIEHTQYASREFTNSKPGTLSMSNGGPNKNASRFFVTLGETLGELDRFHVPFGRVVDGVDVLRHLNEIQTDSRRSFAPKHKVIVADCGFTEVNGGAMPPLFSGSRTQAPGRRQRDDSDDDVRAAMEADGSEEAPRERLSAMASSLKRRRGEVVDQSGQLQSTAIDATHTDAPVATSATEALQMQQLLFAHDLKKVEEAQRYKKGAQRTRKDREQRVASAVTRGGTHGRKAKIRSY